MPIDIQWLDDDYTVIMMTYYGQWSWREWVDCFETFILHDVGDKTPVAIIGDHSHTTHLPLGILDIAKQATSSEFHDLFDLIVLVNPPSLMMPFFSVIQRIYPSFTQRYRFCDTVESAVHIINDNGASCRT